MSDTLERLNAALGDRYRFERELGQGGMAIVYLAYDVKHGRQVAVKVLRPELAQALGPDRFLREIRITAKLNHPHILPLHDSGEAEGFIYYVMPYVEGETLRTRLQRDGRLPVAQATHIARQVADALAYAHRHDIIHRDVKPENILLENGHAVVADFGIARAVTQAGGDQLTHTGLAVGTPVYMSPEQATPSGELDGRSDIYSLGCVLYEMLTGAPPFGGQSVPEIIAARFTTSVPSATAARHDTPPDVEAALEKALAPLSGDRFRTADDFAVALGGRVTDTPTSGVPGRRRVLRRPWAWVAGVAVVLVVGAALVWWRSASSRAAALLAQVEPDVTAGRLSAVYETLAASGLSLGSRGLASLADRVGGTAAITSTPPGASAQLTRVDPVSTFDQRSPQKLGRTPVAGLRLVAGEYLVWISLAGMNELHVPLHVAVSDTTRLAITLVATDSTTADQVWVAGGRSPVHRGAAPVQAFLIERHEVTNEEFQRFVNAGGYRDASLWPESLLVDDRLVPRAAALSRFVDKTGIAGPRLWTRGQFPEGKADDPVIGVSWYEAQAYARWSGGTLPTWDQWWRAALGDSATAFPWGNDALNAELRANFSFDGTRPVETHPLDVSPFGVLDMAGNVREWLADVAPDARHRTVAGGSWQGPSYMFDASHAEVFAPSFASEAIGFRLVRRP